MATNNMHENWRGIRPCGFASYARYALFVLFPWLTLDLDIFHVFGSRLYIACD